MKDFLNKALLHGERKRLFHKMMGCFIEMLSNMINNLSLYVDNLKPF